MRKRSVVNGKEVDTELVGVGTVDTRSREEGIYEDCESEHSMQLTNGNNAKNTCKVNRKEDREKDKWKNEAHGKDSD